jgi:capsular exopolysaccharide synthesis family protein
MPLLGIVPLIETNKALIQKSADLEKKILEPFRSLRANLKHLAATYNYKTFMICSAIKGEGKTTLAANLAITFALDGKKTILVDADLRRSQLHALFTIPKEHGLADYLFGTKTADEILKKTVYENLSVITSGERPHNPAELVGTYRFDLIIKELKERADIIIFDSPALLPVSDGMTMAPKVDGCIMVFRTTWTPLKAAKQAKFQIARLGCHILGGIFNGVSLARSYYPYYYGYYGYYSYTKYNYEEEPKKRFSLRQFGLRFENSARHYVHNLRYSLPKHVGAGSYFARQLIRKKTFWVLLLLLLGISGAEFWLRFRQAPEIAEKTGITYISIGGSGSSEAIAPARSSTYRSAMPNVPTDTTAKTAHNSGGSDSAAMGLKRNNSADSGGEVTSPP